MSVKRVLVAALMLFAKPEDVFAEGEFSDAPTEQPNFLENDSLSPLVVPPAPDVFGKSALLIGAKRQLSKWNDTQKMELLGSDLLWSQLLGQAADGSPFELMERVNSWVNRNISYEDDTGQDLWSAAIDTLIRRTGDCEDIAIVKMAILKRMGILSDHMALVLVREKYRRMEHAVLRVQMNDEIYVLDNRTNSVLPDQEIEDYDPEFAFSENFSWIYGDRLAPGILIPAEAHVR